MTPFYKDLLDLHTATELDRPGTWPDAELTRGFARSCQPPSVQEQLSSRPVCNVQVRQQPVSSSMPVCAYSSMSPLQVSIPADLDLHLDTMDRYIAVSPWLYTSRGRLAQASSHTALDSTTANAQSGKEGTPCGRRQIDRCLRLGGSSRGS
jgi:hypothetical protein